MFKQDNKAFSNGLKSGLNPTLMARISLHDACFNGGSGGTKMSAKSIYDTAPESLKNAFALLLGSKQENKSAADTFAKAISEMSESNGKYSVALQADACLGLAYAYYKLAMEKSLDSQKGRLEIQSTQEIPSTEFDLTIKAENLRLKYNDAQAFACELQERGLAFNKNRPALEEEMSGLLQNALATCNKGVGLLEDSRPSSQKDRLKIMEFIVHAALGDLSTNTAQRANHYGDALVATAGYLHADLPQLDKAIMKNNRGICIIKSLSGGLMQAVRKDNNAEQSFKEALVCLPETHIDTAALIEFNLKELEKNGPEGNYHELPISINALLPEACRKFGLQA